jgi:hypothetical protein
MGACMSNLRDRRLRVQAARLLATARQHRDTLVATQAGVVVKMRAATNNRVYRDGVPVVTPAVKQTLLALRAEYEQLGTDIMTATHKINGLIAGVATSGLNASQSAAQLGRDMAAVQQKLLARGDQNRAAAHDEDDAATSLLASSRAIEACRIQRAVNDQLVADAVGGGALRQNAAETPLDETLMAEIDAIMQGLPARAPKRVAHALPALPALAAQPVASIATLDGRGSIAAPRAAVPEPQFI